MGMTSTRRNAIVSLVLVGATLGLATFRLPEAIAVVVPSLAVQYVVVVLVVALLLNLGLPMTYRTSTFVPVVALTAFLSWGLPTGLWMMLGGLLAGGVVSFVQEIDRDDPQRVWWVALGKAFWPLASHGLGLMLASFAYFGLSASTPLTEIAGPEGLLPVVAAAVLYLLVYNALLGLDVWLAGEQGIAFFVENRRVLLAGQVLPLPLAPVAAVALTALGLPAFLVLMAALVAIAVAVNNLMAAQGFLQKQVRQLSSYSSVGRAVRASLELGELLGSVYLQVSHLLDIENFYVVLLDEDTNQLHFPFVVREGRREDRPSQDRRNSFSEWVMDQQRPLLVARQVERTAERLGLSPPEGGLQSWMGVPLTSADKALGCMAVYTVGEEAERFDDEDLELFGNVATQASVAVENALLYRDARQHARQLASLNEISTVMNASLDPGEVLNLLSSSIIRVAGCDKAAIYLLEEGVDPPRFELSHAQGFSEGFMAMAETVSVPLSDAEREAVLETGEVIAIPDIRTATNISPGLVALAESEKFQAYANFPLQAHGHPIGLLAVYYDSRYRFSESELELLQTFANQAALAVANARQYTVTDQALTRRVDQIMVLADINRRMSATLDLDRIFHLVIDSAMEACNAVAGMLVVAEGENGKMRIGSWRGYPKDVIERLQRSEKAGVRGISERVMRTGRTALVADVTKDPDFMNSGIGTRSQLSVPVVLEDKVIGVVTLESDQEAAFNDEDVAFVGQLAIQAGVAIKNAHLYRRVGEVNDRLHAILDASSDGLVMLDNQGRIVMTNTAMERFWEFAREDEDSGRERSVDQVVADPLSAIGEGLGYAEGELGSLLRTAVRDPEMPEQYELFTVGGKSTRFVERSARAVTEEFGSTIGLLLVFRDVTEQKELEEARENLANMIVHDLRNPLTAVLASLTLVNNAVADQDETGVAKNALGVSSRAVRKLLVMVNNLLDLGRLETGEFRPEQKRATVRSLVENAVGEMLPLAMEMEVTITMESEVLDALPDVNVDRDMIERVVLNLLDNALKFSPPGTDVQVHTEVVGKNGDAAEGGDSERLEMVQIEIVDGGPGIPDEYKSRIFERYRQVRGQKGRGRGTGLGLAFVRQAVEGHGGRVWVEDAAGGGSKFIFTVPTASEAGPTEE